VKRLLSVLLVLAFVSSLSSCGGKFFIRGAINTTTISGTVSFIQITTIVDNGGFVTVTLVTFLLNGSSTNINFCGDQQTMFPMDQFVVASFMPGPPCATIVQITIG